MPSPKPERGKPSATYQAAQKAKRKAKPKTLAGFKIIEPTPDVLRMIEERSSVYGFRQALLPDPVTLERIADLARINATDREIALALRVHPDTFVEFKKANPVVNQVLDANRGDGKISLRRAQWQAAVEDRVPSMMIWLGKNELGQSDKAEIQHDVNIQVLRALMELGDD